MTGAIRVSDREPGEPLRIGERVDLDDPPADHGEGHQPDQLVAIVEEGARGAVDEDRPHRAPEGGTETGAARDGIGAAHQARGRGVATVDAVDDLGVEQTEERLEVTLAGGGEEGVDDPALPAAVGRRRDRCTMHLSPRPARQLDVDAAWAPPDWERVGTELAVSPLGEPSHARALLVGRPALRWLPSELVRLQHLAAIAASVSPTHITSSGA